MRLPKRRTVLRGGAAAGLASAAGIAALWQRKVNMSIETSSASPLTASEPLQPIAAVVSAQGKHWVGDGFHVHTIFSVHSIDPQILSPFVLLDYAAPRHFEPTKKPRGVGEHPHRGFETVTFALQGEIAHRDSFGGGGTIGPGDVQWMTAGSGVVHEEFQSQPFAESGGTMEMVQLWVNLPARLKMTTPRYQSLTATQFPTVSLGAGTARVFAGQLTDVQGPALTHSPITAFELSLDANADARLPARFRLDDGTTTLALVLEGEVRLQDSHDAKPRDLVVFDRQAPGAIHVTARSAAKLLVINGEPLNEPVVAHGPFVMNTREEIVQAFTDYQNGAMGTLRPHV